MPTSEDAASYRLFAAYCVEIAQDHHEPARKVALLNMAQAWNRLAQQIEQNSAAGPVRRDFPITQRP